MRQMIIYLFDFKGNGILFSLYENDVRNERKAGSLGLEAGRRGVFSCSK